jgi:acetolactate synthase-1/2/3 large subunit
VTAISGPREKGLHALDIVEAMAETLDDEAVVVVDGGNIGQWFHQTMARDRYPETFLTCGASGVVGYGIGGAMAARAGYPDRAVVLLSGDGAATFNIADLECAARQSLPFVMIVADDESWGITVTGHMKSYGEAMSCRLGPVDFAGLANSLGALGIRVESKEEMVTALRRGLGERLPVLIHAPISGGLPGEDA